MLRPMLTASNPTVTTDAAIGDVRSSSSETPVP